jgi:hypothetical protein
LIREGDINIKKVKALPTVRCAAAILFLATADNTRFSFLGPLNLIPAILANAVISRDLAFALLPQLL